MVLSSCLPHGSASSSGLCSGPAPHAPVGDVVTSFLWFLCYIVFYLLILLSFLTGVVVAGYQFLWGL